MFCREHAAQLRDEYGSILERGAEVVAVGTGDAMYARDFVEKERVPFLVLVDDDGAAAEAASVKTGSMSTLMNPRNWARGARALTRGHVQRRNGKRPAQLGATFVIGPGPVVRYEHLDDLPSDHALMEEVLGALPG